MSPNPLYGFVKEFRGSWSVGWREKKKKKNCESVAVKVCPLFHWGERVHTFKRGKIGIKSCRI